MSFLKLGYALDRTMNYHKRKIFLLDMEAIHVSYSDTFIRVADHPCLRASLLPKRFGWGVHYNTEGKISLYGKESPEYVYFISQGEDVVKLVLHQY